MSDVNVAQPSVPSFATLQAEYGAACSLVGEAYISLTVARKTLAAAIEKREAVLQQHRMYLQCKPILDSHQRAPTDDKQRPE